MSAPKLSNSTLLTSSELLSAYAEFLTVAIHTIIYERAIYAPESFALKRKYNFPVRQSRHPEVCDWVRNSIEACLGYMRQGEIAKICLVILSSIDVPLERFVFDMNTSPKMSSPDMEYNTYEVNISDMDEQFRAPIMKLGQMSSVLGKLPPDCTFTLTIEMVDNAKPPTGPESPWVVADGRPQHSDEYGISSHSNSVPPKVWPLRNVSLGSIAFDIWVEESKQKQKLMAL